MMRKFKIYCCILVLISFNIVAASNDDTTRIMGGSLAPDGLAPYMCSISTFYNHRCGCSIISPYWVLTAAHCRVWESPVSSEVRILVGTNNLKTGGTYYNVTKFIRHDKFDGIPVHGYDIALIKVEEPIKFNSKVQPIKYSKKSLPVGEHALFTGWGFVFTSDENLENPDDLQMIQMKVVPRSECKSHEDTEDIDSSILCTSNGPGEGACKGDSGGPLVWNDVQVGIASYTAPMCPANLAVAFTDVSVLYDWIESHVT